MSELSQAKDSRALQRVASWMERNTMCALQSREGWYAADCLERHARSKCERCKALATILKCARPEGAES